MIGVTIVPCTTADAADIARAVLMALHMDYDPDSATGRLFTALAARPDSQYSYRNALKAVTDTGATAGVIVTYDGGRLHTLQQAFRDEFGLATGRRPDRLTEETVPGEWYIDSLAVFPGYRRRGVARDLIESAIRRAPSGLTPALLCAKDNPDARKLYLSLGFGPRGERPFFDEMMDLLVLESTDKDI